MDNKFYSSATFLALHSLNYHVKDS